MTTTKTIPFTLEAWKAGGNPVLRKGQFINDLSHLPNLSGKTLIGAWGGTRLEWFEDGSFNFIDIKSENDLLLEVTDLTVPEVAYGIVQRNPYSKERPICMWSFLYQSQQEAEKAAREFISERMLAIVQITKIKDL